MKKCITVILTAAMAVSMNITAFAAGWQPSEKGWQWQKDDGTYATGCWEWLDGNKDGIAECYCFSADGYMLSNTETPDKYTVNQDGAWVVNGVVQTKNVAADTAAAQYDDDYSGTYTVPRRMEDGTVKDMTVKLTYAHDFSHCLKAEWSNGETMEYLDRYREGKWTIFNANDMLSGTTVPRIAFPSAGVLTTSWTVSKDANGKDILVPDFTAVRQ